MLCANSQECRRQAKTALWGDLYCQREPKVKPRMSPLPVASLAKHQLLHFALPFRARICAAGSSVILFHAPENSAPRYRLTPAGGRLSPRASSPAAFRLALRRPNLLRLPRHASPGHGRRRGGIQLELAQWKGASAPIRQMIEAEAESLGQFLGSPACVGWV
jgi:hypothetical protein